MCGECIDGNNKHWKHGKYRQRGAKAKRDMTCFYTHMLY